MPRYLLSALVAAAALLALLPGCGGPPRGLPEKAEAAVNDFLDAWTRGEPPERFADPGRPVQGGDPEWQAGHRLLSFLIADSKVSQESPPRVRCRASLSLQDRKGRKLERDVLYDVQLGPPVVIARAAR